ncbi:MAG: RNA polymerase sigma factor [Acidobacteria bacterium]|nr:RNA polymerase sigma factor [Acidobacteriota bacterium]
MEATALGWVYQQREVGRLEISEATSLVEQARKGERAAFEKLMQAYSGFVYSLALRMLGRRADAEDVFQETFLRAWKYLASFQSGGNFTHWLKRIATNLCIDRLKAHKRQSTYLEAVQPEEERYEEHGKHEELLKQLLAELPANYRAAVVLFYLEDRSVEEVARTLKQKPGTVKVWLFRARAKMKAALEAKEKENEL